MLLISICSMCMCACVQLYAIVLIVVCGTGASKQTNKKLVHESTQLQQKHFALSDDDDERAKALAAAAAAVAGDIVANSAHLI